MNSTKCLRFRLIPLCWLGLLLLGAACPTTGVDVSTGEGTDLITITQVTVPGDNKVLIAGSNLIEGFPFTLADPLRVVVDIKAATTAADLAKEIEGKGLITKVEVQNIPTLSPPVVRIIAYVSQAVTYDLQPKGNGLLLTLAAKSAQAAAAEAEPVAPEGALPYEETRRELQRLLAGAPPPASNIVMPRPSSTSAAATSGSPPIILPQLPPPNSDGTANVVGEIYYRTLGRGIQIMIYTNGPVANFVKTDGASSLIIELPGLAPVNPRAYGLNWGGVNSINVSKAGNKTRVVINFTGGRPNYEITKTSSGLVITIY